jgi:stringent starvation protein B
MSPSKKDAMLLFLQSSAVRVHIDPTVDGVVLPLQFIESGRPLRLDYSFDAPIPIGNLLVDDRGISATLSFNLLPHQTFVPWNAVFCLVAPEYGGIIWNEDVPDALDALGESEAGAQGLPHEQVRKARPDWMRSV